MMPKPRVWPLPARLCRPFHAWIAALVLLNAGALMLSLLAIGLVLLSFFLV